MATAKACKTDKVVLDWCRDNGYDHNDLTSTQLYYELSKIANYVDTLCKTDSQRKWVAYYSRKELT